MSNTSPLLDPAVVQRRAGELSARDTWSRSALLDLQRERLSGLLAYAVAGSRYYRDTLGTLGHGASLGNLPVLAKTTLMNQWDRIVTDSRLTLRAVETHLAGPHCGELVLGEYRAFAIGGTTGERSIVVYDRAGWLDLIGNSLNRKCAARFTTRGTRGSSTAMGPRRRGYWVRSAIRVWAFTSPRT
jgi:phenylacetate-coenzyme A ligase PaaK-like adenylate-forming protein